MNTLLITLIQTHLHWEDKAANLAMLEAKIRGIGEPTQIVVLPEMFSTGFSMRPEALAEPEDGPTVAWMRRLAMELRIIITGSIIIEEGGRYYNRLIWMQPDGQLGRYDKRHCFTLAGEREHYTGGEKRLIASVGGWRIHTLICYDLRFPVWSRQQSTAEAPEYDVLLYVANWPERRALAWRTLLQARAIENQCYAVGVNRVGEDGNSIPHSGDSSAFDPLGEMLYGCGGGREDVFTIRLEKKTLDDVRERLPFWKDADGFVVVLG